MFTWDLVQIGPAIWYQMDPLMKVILCGTIPFQFSTGPHVNRVDSYQSGSDPKQIWTYPILCKRSINRWFVGNFSHSEIIFRHSGSFSGLIFQQTDRYFNQLFCLFPNSIFKQSILQTFTFPPAKLPENISHTVGPWWDQNVSGFTCIQLTWSIVMKIIIPIVWIQQPDQASSASYNNEIKDDFCQITVLLVWW